jgi:hypothetical protein
MFLETSLTPLPTTEITQIPTIEPETLPSPWNSGVSFTKEDVFELFIDIAFGCDNTGVNLFTPSHENHLFYHLEGKVTDEDIEQVTQFTKNFNRLISFEVFSDNPLSKKGSPIIIYPPSSLDSLDKSFIACQEINPANGDLLYLIYTPLVDGPNGETELVTRIYLNADLQGAERSHYLQKAMLYYLGFSGETYDYPDSAFYYDNRSSSGFTSLDIEAMKTMYHPGIYQGMSIQEVRWLLLDE